MLKLSSDFRARLDFEAAVVAELDRPPDRLPSRIADLAARGHTDEFAQRVAGLCASGFEPEREQIVWMPKGTLSYRPLSALPLLERVVYRAFARDFENNVGELDAFAQTQATFESTLISDDEREDIQYVVITDVTSFYRYVSHALLEARIVETTARSDLAGAVRTFLDSTMNSEFGLPQNLGPSDLFADVILTPVERRLLRAGVATTRFNDDFRLGTRSLTDAREALEMLQRHVHEVGLTLNESKTTIMRRDGYVSQLGQITTDDYVEEIGVPSQPTADSVEEATTELKRALQITRQRRRARTRLEEAQAVATVRRLLRRFTSWSHAGALTFGRPIVNRHSSLTQNYARYARQLVESGREDDVADYLAGAFDEMVLTDWQELWLLEPLLSRDEQPTNIAAWISSRVHDPHTPVLLRSRALLAAGRAGLADSNTIARLIDTLPPVAQPDAIAAFAAASPDAEAVSKLGGLADSELAKWIFEDNYDNWAPS